MLLLNIEYIPGKRIEALGMVKGSTVYSKSFGKDFMAGMKTLVGGEIEGYTDLLSQARQIATKRMVDEAAELASAGVKELLVIAQDITRYGLDCYGAHKLPELLRKLCGISGIHWIRLHYLYPEAITDELISVIASQPRILHYLDIPIQHCNDAILKAMRRRNTRAEIEALFAKLRKAMPDVVLRTSLICGLPGEGEAEFEELCHFLREQRIQRAGVFQFSPEEGTLAAAMEELGF
mgnify:CR=1 FL=1